MSETGSSSTLGSTTVSGGSTSTLEADDMDEYPLKSILKKRDTSPRSSDIYDWDHDPRPKDICNRCGQNVYPVDKVRIEFKLVYHRNCFRCYGCGLHLNIANFYLSSSKDREVYCNRHVPRSTGVYALHRSLSTNLSRSVDSIRIHDLRDKRRQRTSFSDEIHYNYIEPSYSDHESPRDPLDFRLSDSNRRQAHVDLEEAYLRNSLARQKRPLNLEDLPFVDEDSATSELDDVIPHKKPNLSEDENRNVQDCPPKIGCDVHMEDTVKVKPQPIRGEVRHEHLPSSGGESSDDQNAMPDDEPESDLDPETHEVTSDSSEHEHDEHDGRIEFDGVVVDDDDDVISRVHVEKTVTYRTEHVSVYKEVLSPRPPRKGTQTFRWDKTRSTDFDEETANLLSANMPKSKSYDDLDPRHHRPSPQPRKNKPDLRERSQSPKPDLKPKPNVKPKPKFSSPLASPVASPRPTARKTWKTTTSSSSHRESPPASPTGSPKSRRSPGKEPDSNPSNASSSFRPVPKQRPTVVPRNSETTAPNRDRSRGTHNENIQDEQSSDSGIFETPLLKPSQAAKFFAQKMERPDVAAKPKVVMRVPKPSRDAEPRDVTIGASKPETSKPETKTTWKTSESRPGVTAKADVIVPKPEVGFRRPETHPSGKTRDEATLKPVVGPKRIPSTELWAKPKPKVDEPVPEAELESKPVVAGSLFSVSTPNLNAGVESNVKLTESVSADNLLVAASDPNRPTGTSVTKPPVRKWEPVPRSHYKSPFQSAELPPVNKPLQPKGVGGPSIHDIRTKIELARAAFLGLERPAQEESPQLPESTPPDEVADDITAETNVVVAEMPEVVAETAEVVAETPELKTETAEQQAETDEARKEGDGSESSDTDSYSETSDTSEGSVVEVDITPANDSGRSVPQSNSTDSGFASYLGPVETDIDTSEVKAGKATKPSPKKKVTFKIEAGTFPVDRDESDPIEELMMQGQAPIASLLEPELDLPAMDDTSDEDAPSLVEARPAHITALLGRTIDGVTMEVDTSETTSGSESDCTSSDSDEVKVGVEEVKVEEMEPEVRAEPELRSKWTKPSRPAPRPPTKPSGAYKVDTGASVNSSTFETNIDMNVHDADRPKNDPTLETDIDADVRVADRPNNDSTITETAGINANVQITDRPKHSPTIETDIDEPCVQADRPETTANSTSEAMDTENQQTTREHAADLETPAELDARPEIHSYESSPVRRIQPATVELPSSPPRVELVTATIEVPPTEIALPQSEMNLDSLQTMVMTMELPKEEAPVMVPPPTKSFVAESAKPMFSDNSFHVYKEESQTMTPPATVQTYGATMELPSTHWTTEEPRKPRVETSIDDFERKQKRRESSGSDDSRTTCDPNDSRLGDTTATDATLTSSECSPRNDGLSNAFQYEPKRMREPDVELRNPGKLARSVSEIVEINDAKYGPERHSNELKVDANWDKRSSTSSVIRPSGETTESLNLEVVPIAEEERLLVAAMTRGTDDKNDASLEQEELVYECFLEENRGNIRRLEAGIRSERDNILRDLGKKNDTRTYNEPPPPARGGKSQIGTNDILTNMAMSSLGVVRYAKPPVQTPGTVGGVTAMSLRRRREEEEKTQPVRVLPFQTSRPYAQYSPQRGHPRGMGPPGYRQAQPRGPRSQHSGSQYSYQGSPSRYRGPAPTPQEFPGGRLPQDAQSNKSEEPQPGTSGYSTYPQRVLPPGATPLQVQHLTRGSNKRVIEADITPRIDRRPDQSAPPETKGEQEIKRTSRLDMHDEKRLVKPAPNPRSRPQQKSVTPGDVMSTSLDRGDHRPFTTSTVEESKTKTFEGSKKVVKKTFSQRQTSIEQQGAELPSTSAYGVQEKVDKVASLVREVKAQVRRDTNVDDLEDRWGTPTRVQRGQSHSPGRHPSPGRHHSPGRHQSPGRGASPGRASPGRASPGRSSNSRSPARNGSNNVMFITTQPAKPTEAALNQAQIRLQNSPKIKDDAVCVKYKTDLRDTLASGTDTSSESLHGGRARSRSKERPSSVIEVEVVHLDSPKYKPRDQQKRHQEKAPETSSNVMNESFSSVSSVNESYERKSVRTPIKSPKYEIRSRPRSQEFDTSLDDEVAEIHMMAGERYDRNDPESPRARGPRTPEFQTTTRIHNNVSSVHETTMDGVIHDVVHEQMSDAFGPDTPKNEYDDKKKAVSSPFKNIFYRSKRKGKDSSLNSSFEGSITSETSRPKSPADELRERKRSKSPFDEFKEWRNRPKSPAEELKEEKRRKKKEEAEERRKEEKEKKERERKEMEEAKEKERKEAEAKKEKLRKEAEEKKRKERREAEEKKEKERKLVEEKKEKERKLAEEEAKKKEKEKKSKKVKDKRAISEERPSKDKTADKEKASSSKERSGSRDDTSEKRKSRDSSSEHESGYEKVDFRMDKEERETSRDVLQAMKSPSKSNKTKTKTVVTATSKGEVKREEVERKDEHKTRKEVREYLENSRASDGFPVYAKVDRTKKTTKGRGESSSSSDSREVKFSSVPPSADASFVTNGNTSLAWDGHYSIEEVMFDDTAFSGLDFNFDEMLLEKNARRGEVYKMLSEDPSLEEKIRRVAAKRARELDNQSVTESELSRSMSQSQESLSEDELKILEAKIAQYFEMQKTKRVQMLLKKFLSEKEGRLSKILSDSDEILDLIAQKARDMDDDDRELYGSADLASPPPEVAPPRIKRTVLYNESAAHFEELDTMVIEVAKLETTNFTELVRELTVNCKDDMDKLRAIYRWVTVKDLDRLELTEESNSPLLELLRGIREGTESYHTLFKKLCAYVGLHCQIIHGYSKGAGYRPGMNIEHPHFRNTWTAVYMNGSWRFVNCNWGARHYKSDTDDDKLTYKCDEFYFLTDPQDHIYQHFPDDDKWQLLTNPISISAFMRLPVTKSPFFNAGLTFGARYDDRLYTEDGRCEVELRMSKFVGFHCVLERLEDGNVVSEPEECTLIRTKDNAVIFAVAPPDIGRYYFNIYVAHDWKSNSLEHACALQVVAGDDCYDNVSNGVFPNVGMIGRTPVLDQLGIQLPRGLDPLLMMGWRSDTILPMTVPNDIRLSHQMKLYSREGKLISDYDQYAFLRSGRAYSVHLPKEGIFALTIYASDAHAKNSKMECILKYLLDCDTPNPDLQPFPRASRRWVGCTLYEPLQGQLEINSTVRFKIDIPNAVEVTVVIDDRWENLEFSERLQDVWEGSVDVGEKPGRCGVYARFDEKSDKFSPMLDYVIVKRRK